MVVRVVRLGSPRVEGEGTRIGTVRRPPRGVPKAAFASQNWYDVWFPNLAPSVETMKSGQTAATPREWLAFFEEIPGRDGNPREQPDSRSARNAVASCELLRRLLLRRRVTLPSLDPARIAPRKGREDRVTCCRDNVASHRVAESADTGAPLSAAPETRHRF